MMRRVYALPPKECNHPWIIRRFDKPYRECEHEIVDVGILDILKPPHIYTPEKIATWKEIETDGWKVIPDCFDLLGEKDINCGFDTVLYSKHLINTLYDIDDPHHLPVIQCKSNNLESVKEYCRWFKSLYPTPKQIAVSGSIGRSNNREFMYKSLKYIRDQFPDSWIHIFALSKYNMKYKDTILYYDSFDNSTWVYPQRNATGRGLTRNNKERIEFFNSYKEKLIVMVKRLYKKSMLI